VAEKDLGLVIFMKNRFTWLLFEAWSVDINRIFSTLLDLAFLFYQATHN
jgi:hypothetical protein